MGSTQNSNSRHRRDLNCKWKTSRILHLFHHPNCVHSNMGRTRPARSHPAGPELVDDESNLQGRKSCHSRKTRMEVKGKALDASFYRI